MVTIDPTAGTLTLSNFTASDLEILGLVMGDRGGIDLELAIANVIRLRRLDQRERQRDRVKEVLGDPSIADTTLKSLYDAATKR